MRDPKKNVTFVFYCYEKESADLKVRLKYDGLQQSEFFRALLKMYITNDPDMLILVEKIKEKQKTMGKFKRNRAMENIKKGRDLLGELGITKEDKEKIYDLIEVNTEDYE